MNIKEFLDAIKRCALFIPNTTTMPRWLEITGGIMFWISVLLTLYGPVKYLLNLF